MTLKFGKMRRGIAILIIIFIVLIIGGLISGYYVFNRGESDEKSAGTGSGVKLINPAEGLSLEEAVKKFDESFVAYLLINIKAYNLHPPVFGSDIPKIKIYVGGQAYNAEVTEGRIKVGKGEIAEEDIIIWTSAEEAVKMVRDKNYISESFKTGASKIELVAGKIELAMKGYISLYNEFTGKGG